MGAATAWSSCCIESTLSPETLKNEALWGFKDIEDRDKGAIDLSLIQIYNPQAIP